MEFLIIAHEDPAFEITDGEGFQQSFELGAQPASTDGVERSGRWKGGAVVLKNRREERGETVRTFSLSDDGAVLTVQTKISGQGRRPSFSFRQVYDRLTVEPLSEGESSTPSS